jgi:hypothetical protein
MVKKMLIKTIVKLRMFYADVRGHHGKRWDYEPSEHYMRKKNNNRR